MSSERLFDILRAKEEFCDIDSWHMISMAPDVLATFSCKLTKDGISYFVKEIQPPEVNSLFMILPLGCKHFIRTSYPELLNKGVLVADFSDGGPYTSTRLSHSLIGDYATMQRLLNEKSYYDMHYRGDKSVYLQSDDGRYRKRAYSHIGKSIRILEFLREEGNSLSPNYHVLFSRIDRIKDRVAHYYSTMPFAWLHNDFRNENIVGELPVIVDWGNSFGYGPLLHDIAPYLLGHEEDIELFLSIALENRNVDLAQARKWVMAAVVFRLAGAIVWHHFRSMKKLCDFDAGFKAVEQNFPIFRELDQYLHILQD